MPYAANSRFGPFEIVAHIGAGGMGDVYKARDTRLDRIVALKISKSQFRERFDREARAIAGLNHPGICTLHDAGSEGNVDYLVMEFVEGEPLSARLRRGPLPLDLFVRYGSEIAAALAAAHARGVIHRDLKPGNIMITPAGVKLLDFGLAKFLRPAETAEEITAAMTVTQDVTAAGAIVGTLSYMAPEQLEGRACDARTDIFAFGAVLYEMITGRKAFEGKSAASVIAGVLERDPQPISELKPITPPALEHVVQRCLEKHPERRWQAASDVRMELEWAAKIPAQAAVGVAARRSAWIPWAVAAVAVAGCVALGVRSMRSAGTGEQTIQFSVDPGEAGATPENASVVTLPLPSPDGRMIAWVGRSPNEAAPAIWLRGLESETPRKLAGTEGAASIFWSHDGAWIGFYSGGALKKAPLAGGRPQKVTDIAFRGRGTWSQSGDIVFNVGNRTPLFHVRESGGEPKQITKLDSSRGENSHRYPQFLPDGKTFLFIARCADRKNNALYAGDLQSGKTRVLMPLESKAEFVPARGGRPAAIVFVRDGTLFAQPFDPDTQRIRGEAAALLENVAYEAPSLAAMFETSANGRLLIYRTEAGNLSRLEWTDRSGKPAGRIAPPVNFIQPRISPDGARILFSRPDERTGNRDIWSVETARGLASRLTSHAGNDWFGIWLPDSRRFLFASDRTSSPQFTLYEKGAVDAGSEDKSLLVNAEPHDVSKDGKWVAFVRISDSQMHNIWVMPRAGGREFSYLGTVFDESGPRFSPDARWIAYTSNESGTYQVYARRFFGRPAGDEPKYQVSIGGGDYPAWSKDGRELFFLAGDQWMMSVRAQDLERSTAPAVATRLFQSCAGTGLKPALMAGTGYLHAFDVAPDGRFLINCRAAPEPKPVLIWNWR